MAAGVEFFAINTHHRAEAFQELFGQGDYRGHEVRLVHEPEILGTGGGIKNVESLLGDEPFITCSGDLLTDIAYAPLLKEHASSGNDVTIALRETGFGRDVAFE
ncbi:MAG TPA: sugar phosphate nucleotidyltransferase, partial [Chthoniobacterales bacterium]